MTNDTKHITYNFRPKTRASALWTEVVSHKLLVISFRKTRAMPGFTVLFAMLIATLLLGVGLAIFDIIFKEVSFATVVRDSSYAIYAADTGNECALYWDFKCDQGGACGGGRASGFASSTASVLPSGPMMCNTQDIKTANVDVLSQAGFSTTRTASAATTSFAIYMSTDASGNHVPAYCAIVQVIKFSDAGGVPHTYIISRGYNTCDVANPNRIERAYFISY